MGRAALTVKIAIGFIDDQCKSMGFGEIIKGLNNIRWIFHPARVVGSDQHNGLGAFGDAPGCLSRIRNHISLAGQSAAAHAAHIKPHFVIEIERRGKNDLITIAAKRCHNRTERLIAP